MSIPLHLAVYGGLIPAAVAALVFYLGALATRRVAWSGAPWAGVAIADAPIKARMAILAVACMMEGSLARAIPKRRSASLDPDQSTPHLSHL